MSRTARKKPPATARETLDRKEARTGEIGIVLKASLLDALEEAKTELKRAQATEAVTLSNPKATEESREAASKRVVAAGRKVDRAQAAVDAETVTFAFRAIGGRAYDDLLRAHPPTPVEVAAEQKRAKAAGEKPRMLAYSEASFPPALFAASCVAPQFTEEEAAELWASDSWNDQELDTLFGAAYAVNKLI